MSIRINGIDYAADGTVVELIHGLQSDLAAERERFSRAERYIEIANATVLRLETELTAERERADRAVNNLAALEDEKNTYMDYVGDALGQDHDGESLWDAAQRVLSDRDRLRAELAAARADVVAAAGAFLVDLPEPGSDMARVMLANAQMRRERDAARAERAITASPWRYKEWGGLVVGGGEGSAEVLICTMATNTRHDEGRHNRELIIEAPTLRARLDKAEAELAAERERAEKAEALRAALDKYGQHHESCGDADAYNGAIFRTCNCGLDAARAGGG